jgi:hypothetical protein
MRREITAARMVINYMDGGISLDASQFRQPLCID